MAVVLEKCTRIPDEDFETTMEGHLHKAGLLPTRSSPVVDLDAFIEQYLKASLDTYCDSLDDGELGVTEFRFGKPPHIKINRTLTDAADDSSTGCRVLGRWRFTIAHEVSHVVLHRLQVEAALQQQSLFGSDEAVFQLAPFRGELFPSSKVDEREWQANRGASALLMPRDLLREVATPLVRSVETSRNEDFASSQAMKLVIAEIAQVFQVSKKAAGIRFDKLCLTEARHQERLKI